MRDEEEDGRHAARGGRLEQCGSGEVYRRAVVPRAASYLRRSHEVRGGSGDGEGWYWAGVDAGTSRDHLGPDSLTWMNVPADS